MVNYEALSIGLSVEFQFENAIKKGIVKYKGPLNCKSGDWIGIEANEPIGYCDGRLNGRVYFKCPDLHGIFLTADELRKSKNLIVTKSRKIYKPLGLECDELLFKKSVPKDYLVCITEDYLERAKTSFEKKSYDDIFSSGPRHTISETLVFKPKVTNRIKKSTGAETTTFHPVSSISKTYMPKEELELYTKLNWSHKNIKNLPRNASIINKTFDSFNLNRSNYIEPNIKQ